eukprot:CAMPEP_0114259374 /NCGR_PEP_ID=MMETSP0058-20121206/19859_1 /TAXON_ID=36894 /ORGANISM="Pyramimonas parkeae, CCMP726" /LENGTH=650 /DNA_ID=CAMNT_0001374417 /DNA_START=15 /DNA_END=1967 /DNA_ORIENTATION=+
MKSNSIYSINQKHAVAATLKTEQAVQGCQAPANRSSMDTPVIYLQDHHSQSMRAIGHDAKDKQVWYIQLALKSTQLNTHWKSQKQRQFHLSTSLSDIDVCVPISALRPMHAVGPGRTRVLILMPSVAAQRSESAVQEKSHPASMAVAAMDADRAPIASSSSVVWRRDASVLSLLVALPWAANCPSTSIKFLSIGKSLAVEDSATSSGGIPGAGRDRLGTMPAGRPELPTEKLCMGGGLGTMRPSPSPPIPHCSAVERALAAASLTTYVRDLTLGLGPATSPLPGLWAWVGGKGETTPSVGLRNERRASASVALGRCNWGGRGELGAAALPCRHRLDRAWNSSLGVILAAPSSPLLAVMEPDHSRAPPAPVAAAPETTPNRVRPGASGDGGVRGVGSRARRQRKHELRGVPAASPKKRFVRSPQEHGGPLPRAPSPVRRVVVVVRRTSRTRPASAELKKMLPHLRREPRLRVKGVLRGGGDEPGGRAEAGGEGAAEARARRAASDPCGAGTSACFLAMLTSMRCRLRSSFRLNLFTFCLMVVRTSARHRGQSLHLRSHVRAHSVWKTCESEQGSTARVDATWHRCPSEEAQVCVLPCSSLSMHIAHSMSGSGRRSLASCSVSVRNKFSSHVRSPGRFCFWDCTMALVSFPA